MSLSENIPFDGLSGEGSEKEKSSLACEKSLARMVDGNVAALSQLYTTLKRPVFLLAYSILQDYALAEDVTQETFLHITEKAASYRPGTNPKAWIFTIARNLALSVLRARKKEDLSDAQLSHTREEPIHRGPEDSAEANAGFARAIAELAPDERSIVILRIEAALPHRDIARILGISYADARVRYFRALKKLKAYYETNQNAN
jgi:RNA polymerase sigma factor, sigma-70 family